MPTPFVYGYTTTAVSLVGSTDLDSKTSGQLVASTVSVDNAVSGGTTNLSGTLLGRFELLLSSGHSITNAGAINVWFLRSADGSNYELGDATVKPGRAPDLTFYPANKTGAQRLVVDGPLPARKFKALFQLANLGDAAALGTSNTFTVNALSTGT